MLFNSLILVVLHVFITQVPFIHSLNFSTMKNTKILVGLLLAYSLNSCDFLKTSSNSTPKDDLTKLPPETQEGKNTFGCLVNGKVWRNQGVTSLYSDNLSITVTDQLTIGATKYIDNIHQGIGIGHPQANKEGIYLLNGANYARYTDVKKQCNYGLGNTPIEGKLEITKFQRTEVNGGKRLIVAGRFHFTIISNECQDTIRVTDGRFDIKL